MKKYREFDLYFGEDKDGIDPYSASICENSEPWTPESDWAEPTIHVIEHQAVTERDEIIKEMEEALLICASLEYKNRIVFGSAPANAEIAITKLKKWKERK